MTSFRNLRVQIYWGLHSHSIENNEPFSVALGSSQEPNSAEGMGWCHLEMRVKQFKETYFGRPGMRTFEARRGGNGNSELELERRISIFAGGH